MVTDLILLAFQGVLNVILAPLTVVNIAIDFVGSIPVVTQFLQIVAYVLPWTNILPIIALIVALFIFRIVLALIKLLKSFVPFWRKLERVYYFENSVKYYNVNCKLA